MRTQTHLGRRGLEPRELALEARDVGLAGGQGLGELAQGQLGRGQLAALCVGRRVQPAHLALQLRVVVAPRVLVALRELGALVLELPRRLERGLVQPAASSRGLDVE
jgi:hypothetical protein